MKFRTPQLRFASAICVSMTAGALGLLAKPALADNGCFPRSQPLNDLYVCLNEANNLCTNNAVSYITLPRTGKCPAGSTQIRTTSLTTIYENRLKASGSGSQSGSGSRTGSTTGQGSGGSGTAGNGTSIARNGSQSGSGTQTRDGSQTRNGSQTRDGSQAGAGSQAGGGTNTARNGATNDQSSVGAWGNAGTESSASRETAQSRQPEASAGAEGPGDGPGATLQPSVGAWGPVGTEHAASRGVAADASPRKETAAEEQARLGRLQVENEGYKRDLDNLERAKQQKVQIDREAGGSDAIENKDSCKHSTALGKEYSCDGTRDFIETARIGGMVAQAGGQLTTSVQGAQAQMSAANSGTQSGALKSAAELQGSAANMQMMLGAGTAIVGAIELYKSFQHKKHEKNFDAELVGKNKAKLKNNQENTSDDFVRNAGHAEKNHGYFKSENKAFGDVIMESGNFGKMNERVSLTEVKTTQKSIDEAKQVAATAQDQTLKREAELKVQMLTDRRNAELALRQRDLDAKKKDIEKQFNHIGTEATDEQKRMKAEAMNAGIQNVAQGMGQLANGYMNNLAADQLAQAAARLKNIEGAQVPFKPTEPGYIGPGDALGPRGSTTISGSGQGGEAASAESSEEKGPGETLGGPMNLSPNPDGLKDVPPPGAKFAGKDPNEAKGGGGGPMGGAGTSPSTGSNEDPQAKLADNRGSFAYEGGGGGGYAGGGGGAGGAEKGPDLSGLLAQFLPKKDEGGPTKDILDFGGRAPAGVEDGGSLLDRKANLFDRIHQTYQEKQKRRNVGLN